ncbi:hypothetical protein [Mucilaginibacter phyllosphaerae]|uniref:Uncharacterized protein n=1 Tax=Mucilaginibacter phyllosphaerae TaxID=1812349 RepID=A0A4Y8AKF8_9SPHI|nr:hypothetical protein [Mucilaginibacter phyllosphaerae]MBB3967445.1 hypothetical protein [Mucilaginibacter phyllosphaerae]TEW69487.1 hypothetical protein E2R65_04770 [Mucilaginibacter phyllosphaerae]
MKNLNLKKNQLTRSELKTVLGGKEQLPNYNWVCACNNNQAYTVDGVSATYALATIDTYCGDGGGYCRPY